MLVSLVFVVSLSACSGSNTESNSIGNKNSPSNIVSPSPIVKEGIIEDENKNAEKTIVFSVLAVNDLYKQAKQRYEEKHPNITIEFKEFAQAGSAMMSPAEVEKYIKTTNTEILSGKGADLFALDIIDLPIDKYVSKNAFVNLDELMVKDKSFDPNLYYMNILDHSKMNGGLYVLPSHFYLQALFGDAVGIEKANVTIDDENWTWSQFADVGKQLASNGANSYSLALLSPEEMLNSLVSDNYAELVDGANRKPNFDSMVFTDLLNQVKSLYDEKILSAEYVPSNFNLSQIYSPEDYLARLSLYYKDGKIYQKPHAAGQKSGVAFGALNNVAMNSNSTIKGTAWDFMKFLLSEEMQNIPQQDGFSMIKSVNEKRLQEIGNKGTIDVPKAGTVQVNKKDLESIKVMISEASLQVTGDNKVQTIIREEATAFFSGQKSAESVAKLIQNRVTTYLNE